MEDYRRCPVPVAVRGTHQLQGEYLESEEHKITPGGQDDVCDMCVK